MTDNLWKMYLSVGGTNTRITLPETPRLGDTILDNHVEYVVTKIVWSLTTNKVFVEAEFV